MYDPGTLYFDPILSGFAVGWKDQNLYGERIFPVTRVRTQSGRYRVFDRSDWLSFADRREPGTIANEVTGRKWSEDTFMTKEHSLQTPIYDEERQELTSQGGFANAVFGGALDINPEQDALNLQMRSIMLKHEKRVADTVRDTTNYSGSHVTTLTGGGTGTRWSNYALATPGDPNTAYSNPVADLRHAVQRVYLDTGEWPNVMEIPFDAVGIIENHPRVVARYTYTSVFDANAWRLLLGLPAGVADGLQVFVADSKMNNADNIDAAEDIQPLWGTDVWLGHVDNADGMAVHTFGKTFSQIYPAGDIRPVDRWREEERKSDLVRTSYKYDLKIVSPDAGYIIKTAVDAVT